MKKLALCFATFLLLLLTALAPVLANPVRYSAGPIKGQVLEAGTHTPLAGVIVVVNWEVISHAHLQAAQLAVMETVTDKNGYFSFPAWGPKTLPPTDVLAPGAPQLLLFKEGYQYCKLMNPTSDNTSHSIALASRRSGETIELRRLPKEMIVNLGPGRRVSRQSLSLNGLALAVGWAYQGKDCEWKQIPRLLAAIERSKEAFDREGVRTDLKSIDDLPTSKQCGSPQAFLRRYLP